MKNALIFLIVFEAIYGIVLFITVPFTVNWGAKRTFDKVWDFFYKSPFNRGKSRFFVVFNGIFWGLIAYLFTLIILFFKK